jgi:hypothetical protein
MKGYMTACGVRPAMEVAQSDGVNSANEHKTKLALCRPASNEHGAKRQKA